MRPSQVVFDFLKLSLYHENDYFWYCSAKKLDLSYSSAYSQAFNIENIYILE